MLCVISLKLQQQSLRTKSINQNIQKTKVFYSASTAFWPRRTLHFQPPREFMGFLSFKSLFLSRRIMIFFTNYGDILLAHLRYLSLVHFDRRTSPRNYNEQFSWKSADKKKAIIRVCFPCKRNVRAWSTWFPARGRSFSSFKDIWRRCIEILSFHKWKYIS